MVMPSGCRRGGIAPVRSSRVGKLICHMMLHVSARHGFVSDRQKLSSASRVEIGSSHGGVTAWRSVRESIALDGRKDTGARQLRMLDFPFSSVVQLLSVRHAALNGTPWSIPVYCLLVNSGNDVWGIFRDSADHPRNPEDG